jgi:hypothetical protein
MRKLLLQLLLLLGSVGLVAALAIWVGVQRPYLDSFYTRFTTPPAGSLTLGTSRAAQAVQTAVLQARLGRRYTGPWLNYAFTLQESPYGPAYLASVQRKLAASTRHGLFIVTTDPWALSMPRPTRPDAPLVFPEDNSMIGQLRNVSQSPNWAYLTNHLHLPFYRVLLHDTASVVRLHADGWLEVVLPPPSADTARLRSRTLEKLVTYRALAAGSQLAAPRLQSLRQLIALLKPHGQVVLVRLPTGPALRTIEDQYQPRFDQLMQHTADSLGVPYLNYLGHNYPTNDGNHLWRGAARTFSQRLAGDIAAMSSE